VNTPVWLRAWTRAWLLPGCCVCNAVDVPLLESRPSLLLCASCAKDWAALPGAQENCGLDSRQAFWVYEGSVRRLLVQAKEMPHGPQAWALLFAMKSSVQQVTIPKGVLWTTPPPSWKRRLHAWYLPQFLAHGLAQSQAQPQRKLLHRRQRVGDQAELNGAARRANLMGVFEGRRGWTRSQVPPRVMLFDDVSTTGATMSEAARALRALGVQEVHGLCVAVVP